MPVAVILYLKEDCFVHFMQRDLDSSRLQAFELKINQIKNYQKKCLVRKS